MLDSAARVDLPREIRSSNYFANVVRRAAVGETPRWGVERLEAYVDENAAGVWDNSWIRFPRRALRSYAALAFENDVLFDKADPASPRRCDADRFIVHENGEAFVRVPVSYLLVVLPNTSNIALANN